MASSNGESQNGVSASPSAFMFASQCLRHSQNRPESDLFSILLADSQLHIVCHAWIWLLMASPSSCLAHGYAGRSGRMESCSSDCTACFQKALQQIPSSLVLLMQGFRRSLWFIWPLCARISTGLLPPVVLLYTMTRAAGVREKATAASHLW